MVKNCFQKVLDCEFYKLSDDGIAKFLSSCTFFQQLCISFFSTNHTTGMQLKIAGFLNVHKASIVFDFSSNESLPESAKSAECDTPLEVVGHVNSSTGEEVHASSSSTSVDHASTNHEGMSEAYDVKSAGNDEGSSHSHSPKKKRKKRGKTKKGCGTCTQGHKTKKCREDCGGRETQRRMCKVAGCGRAAHKNGVRNNVECGGEGRPKCKVDGCKRKAKEDGMCSNQQCTGKLHVEVRTLCSFPGGCDKGALGSGKNRAGKPGEVGLCIQHGGGPRCVAEGCPNGQ